MFKSRNSAIAVLALIVTITALAPVSAQQRARAKATSRSRHQRTTARTAAPTPVALLQNSATDYFSGEANVTVRGNQNPIVRLGMAQNGVTMIEFPASDRFFAIHTGNSDLVTVEESPTKTKDHHMVLRAGSGFVVPLVSGARNASRSVNPATSIIAQMRSGMVITFLMYPVKQLSQQAHRCVISYDREEIVAARRAAGLAVNLGEVETPKAQPPIDLAVANPTPTPAPSQAAAPAPTPEPVVVEIKRKSKRVQGNSAEPNVVVRNALAEAIREPKKFKKWSAPLHGLSVSTLSRDVGERTRMVVVAVRNTNAEAIRIVPGHPEVSVETLDDKGARLQVEQIKKLYMETTTTGSVLPAGAVVYYAVVYETPILGAHQHLRVAVGQTNAADEPTAANLAAAR